MITGQMKYFFLIMATAGLSCLAISFAAPLTDAASGNLTQTSSSNNEAKASDQSQAYTTLTEAEATAKTTDKAADETHEKKPSEYLNRIADNTYAFLKAFNYYSLNWLQIYSAPSSNELDALFGKYIESSQANFTEQLSLLNGIYSLNNPDRFIFNSPLPAPDTSYATLVKQNSKNQQTGEPEKVDDKIKLDAKYFVKNASGINIPHVAPSQMVAGKNAFAVRKYVTFYNTINSISSYNAYVLNEHLADLQKDFKLSQIQMELKSYASDNKWLSHVNEEQSIGVILRQLLLFMSQMYIVSLQQLETEKQLVAAIAMTNSLVILGNGYYEKTLYEDATK